jgi:site-specific recombinase XerD
VCGQTPLNSEVPFSLDAELADEELHSVSSTSSLTTLSIAPLRHFMAIEMLEAGVPIAVIAARLAHSRASTSLNVYAHAVPGSDREAAEVLAARIRV